MRCWLVVVLLAGGCRQLWGLGTPDHAIEDAPIDGPPDVAVDAQSCFGTFGTDAPYCFTARPTDPLTFLVATTINTDTDLRCDTTRTGACVMAASLIEVTAKVTVQGSRPLVLIAMDEIDIIALGEIDASSHHGGGGGGNASRGPAANDASCDHGQFPNLAGGGEGASFGGLGGNGGDTNGQGGRAGVTAVPTTLRGGCQGTTGGNNGGIGGDGGGALYLIAGNRITLGGAINASGASGGGTGAAERGGGGGGSGGLIVLEAPEITVDTGVVFANGGGGGGGGSAGGGGGQSGLEATSVQPPSGGTATAPAGPGGDGSGLAKPTGDSGINGQGGNGGGGGGGGGAGVIKTIGGSITNPLVVSPMPS